MAFLNTVSLTGDNRVLLHCGKPYSLEKQLNTNSNRNNNLNTTTFVLLCLTLSRKLKSQRQISDLFYIYCVTRSDSSKFQIAFP